MHVSRMLHQFEFEIVDYATQAYCDIAADFDALLVRCAARRAIKMAALSCAM